jgi:hypothetical protein
MLPWGQILSAGLSIADIARGIYKSTKKSKESSSESLSLRVDQLENNLVKQAELLTQMADQNQQLIKKVRIYFYIAIGSIIFSIISLITTLIIFTRYASV